MYPLHRDLHTNMPDCTIVEITDHFAYLVSLYNQVVAVDVLMYSIIFADMDT